MHAGSKAALRPILEALIAAARGIAPDVRGCPCQSMVPVYKSRVFAEVKPSTRTRVDLSLALGEFPERGRLKSPANALTRGDRLTHVVALTAPADVDGEAIGWLSEAYRRGG